MDDNTNRINYFEDELTNNQEQNIVCLHFHQLKKIYWSIIILLYNLIPTNFLLLYEKRQNYG